MSVEEEAAGGGGDDGGFFSLSLNKILIIVVVLWVLQKYWGDIRRRYFAAFIDYFSKSATLKTKELKQELFSSLSSVISHDPELRKQKGIKVLEIGVGSGANFDFYPDGTRLIVVDPNPHFKSYYDNNRRKFPNIHSEEIIVTTAEEMDMVEPNSVDVVVSTLVFCSVDNLDKILKQILRVLVPGGKFYFLDHIAEFDADRHSMRKKIQDILTVTRIWPFLFDGCCLNRDMLKEIQQAGFSKVEAQRFYGPFDHPIFQLIKPHLKGVAEK